MKLADQILDKVDDALRDTLQKAEGREHVRAILHLEAEPVRSAAKGAPEPSPGSYDSRADYRRAVVRHRWKQLDRHQGPTIQKLKDLSLEVHGGNLGRTVVVEGPAECLANGLALAEVSEAHLDQEIELIEPVRSGRKIAARTRKPRARSAR